MIVKIVLGAVATVVGLLGLNVLVCMATGKTIKDAVESIAQTGPPLPS